VQAEEYARIHRHETTHFWYRGVHALFAGALARERARDGVRDAARRPVRVLDAGCGTGGLMRTLAAADRDVELVGFDLSPIALELSRGRGHRRLARASIERTPFRADAFDAVVSADVLYHRGVVDDSAALRELARVVRPGGLVLLNLPAHPKLRGAHDEVIHTARRYSRADVERIAAAAGLRIERLAWFNCALLPVAWLARVRSRGGPPRSDVAAPPAAVNALLAAWLRLEARLALRALLPFGLSLFAMLRKPFPSAAREG
jgi:SAM-dependent methyltransferase